MINPAKDGLPALKKYTGPTGEDKLLFLGIERATSLVCKGREIPAADIVFYRKLGQRVKGLMEALDAREAMQGAENEGDGE